MVAHGRPGGTPCVHVARPGDSPVDRSRDVGVDWNPLAAISSCPDNALWTVWQTGPGGAWSARTPPASGVPFDGLLEVGRNADGRLQVFVQGTDKALWTMSQTALGATLGWPGRRRWRASRWASDR
jgi:hypothetical protein